MGTVFQTRRATTIPFAARADSRRHRGTDPHRRMAARRPHPVRTRAVGAIPVLPHDREQGVVGTRQGGTDRAPSQGRQFRHARAFALGRAGNSRRQGRGRGAGRRLSLRNPDATAASGNPGRRGTPRGRRGGSDPRAHVPSLGGKKPFCIEERLINLVGDAGSGRREFRGNRSGRLAARARAVDASRTPHSRSSRRCAPRRAARGRGGNRVSGDRTANLERRGGDHACQVHLPRRSARTRRPLLALAKIGLGAHDWRCTGSHVRGVCCDGAGRTHRPRKVRRCRAGDQQPPSIKMPRENCTGQGDREDSVTPRIYLIRSRAWLQNCNS